MPRRVPPVLTRFFPADIGLRSDLKRSAHKTSQCNFYRGVTFRGCRYSLMFRLPRSLGPQIAPTGASSRLRGSRAVYTTQPPGSLPTPGRGIASHPTRATDAAGLSPAELQPCRLLPDCLLYTSDAADE